MNIILFLVGALTGYAITMFINLRPRPDWREENAREYRRRLAKRQR